MKIWWIKSDPCGMFCALFTVGLLLYAEIVMANVILLPWLGFDINFIIFTSLTVCALVAHTRCQFSDPGSIPAIYIPPALPRGLDFSLIQSRPYNPPKICKTCRTLKTRRTFHCNTCERCILNMDHHCPWVNNCVGANNQRFFFQFLFYTAISCIYTAGLLIARFYSCHSDDFGCDVSSTGALFAILTFIEALVFGIFTVVMMYDQVSGIMEEDFRNEQHYKTQVIAYNAALETEAQYFSDPPRKPLVRSTCELFTDVFGSTFGLGWFNPFIKPDNVQIYQHKQLEECVDHAEHVTHRFVEYARRVNDEFEEQQLSAAQVMKVQPEQQDQPEQDNTDLNPADFKEDEDIDENDGEIDDEQLALLSKRKVPAH